MENFTHYTEMDPKTTHWKLKCKKLNRLRILLTWQNQQFMKHTALLSTATSQNGKNINILTDYTKRIKILKVHNQNLNSQIFLCYFCTQQASLVTISPSTCCYIISVSLVKITKCTSILSSHIFCPLFTCEYKVRQLLLPFSSICSNH